MEQLSFGIVEQSDADAIREAIIKEINNPEYTKHLVVTRLKDESISIRAKSYVCAKIKLSKKTREPLNKSHILSKALSPGIF